jgi:hypothetical protein
MINDGWLMGVVADSELTRAERLMGQYIARHRLGAGRQYCSVDVLDCARVLTVPRSTIPRLCAGLESQGHIERIGFGDSSTLNLKIIERAAA